MIPTRLSGSAPLTVTSSPFASSRRTARSRPTASASAYCSPEKPPTNRPPPIGRHEQCPQPREAIRRDESPGHELPQPLLDLGTEQSGRAHQVSEERSAAVVEDIEDGPA